MSETKQKQEFVPHDEKPKRQKGYLLMSFIFILLLALSVTSLMVLYIDRLPSSVQVGTIAVQDIRADQNYEIVDEAQTAKLKQDALLKALTVYDFDTNLVEDHKSKIYDSFAVARAFGENQEEQLRQQFIFAVGTVLTKTCAPNSVMRVKY